MRIPPGLLPLVVGAILVLACVAYLSEGVSVEPPSEISTSGHYVLPAAVEPDYNAVAFDPVNGLLYVTCPANFAEGANVTVINPTTQQVVAIIPAASIPTDLAVDTSNGNVFVTSAYGLGGTQNVTVINGTTNKVQTTIPLPTHDYPWSIAFDLVNGDFYVAGFSFITPPPSGDNITVINGATDKIVADIPGAGMSVVVDPASQRVFVGNWSQLYVINAATNTLMGDLQPPGGVLPGDPQAMVLDPRNGVIYGVNGTEPQNVGLWALNGSTDQFVGTVDLPPSTDGFARPGIVFDSRSGDLLIPCGYCSNGSWGGGLVVVNPAKDQVLGVGALGQSPGLLTYDPSNDIAYVVDEIWLWVVSPNPQGSPTVTNDIGELPDLGLAEIGLGAGGLMVIYGVGRLIAQHKLSRAEAAVKETAQRRTDAASAGGSDTAAGDAGPLPPPVEGNAPRPALGELK